MINGADVQDFIRLAHRAKQVWGLKEQAPQTMGEAGEFIGALQNYMRGKPGSMEAFYKEWWDLFNMMIQMHEVLVTDMGAEYEEKFYEIRDRVLEQTDGYLKKKGV